MDDYKDFYDMFLSLVNDSDEQDTEENAFPEGRQQLRSRSPQYADKTKKHINT